MWWRACAENAQRIETFPQKSKSEKKCDDIVRYPQTKVLFLHRTENHTIASFQMKGNGKKKHDGGVRDCIRHRIDLTQVNVNHLQACNKTDGRKSISK
jgi:hypothetical protein